MKNTVIVLLDDEAERKIQIAKLKDHRFPTTKDEHRDEIRLDMATLCEALVTLIRAGEDCGLRPSAESLRICIKHLKDGFGAADYKTQYLPDGIKPEGT